MNEFLELEVVSYKTSKKEQVFWLDVEGETGEFVVGPGHHAIVSKLKPKGRIKYKNSQNLEVDMDVYGGGVIYVDNDRVTVVLD